MILCVGLSTCLVCEPTNSFSTEPTMTLTLSKLQNEQPGFVDIPCPGTDDSFRLHLLDLNDFLGLKPMFLDLMESGKVDEDGTAEDDNVVGEFAPFIAKSLGGDFDSADGIRYLERRPDLVALLMRELIGLHEHLLSGMQNAGQASAGEEVKND